MPSDTDRAPSAHEHVTVARAAELLNVTHRRVTQLLQAGRLDGSQRTTGAPWSIDLDSIHEHLRKGT